MKPIEKLWFYFAAPLLLVSFLYLSVAQGVFAWRNPKANATVFWTHLSDGLAMRRMEGFQ